MVAAAGKRRESPSISEWLPTETTLPELVVVCPRITDPDNLGTLIRLCVGFGVRALLLGPGSTDPFSRRVLRVSMGHAFFLPICLPIVMVAAGLGNLISLRNRFVAP